MPPPQNASYLKSIEEVSEKLCGKVRSFIAIDAISVDYQNILRALETSAGCVLVVFGLFPGSSYADPLTFTINDEEVKKVFGDAALTELHHKISWEKGYQLNVDEATGKPHDSGYVGRNFHEGDKAVFSDGWTFIFPLISRNYAISLSPRLFSYGSGSHFLSAVSITGNGRGNSLVINGQDQSTHRGIYIYYWGNISDKDWESNPPKVSIENVDLEISHVRNGIYQYSPSIVEISNEKTVVDCSTYAGSRAFEVASMVVSENLKPFSIAIESGQIEVSGTSEIIYQRLQNGSSVISLNLIRDGTTLLQSVRDKSIYTFNMCGEQVTTNIGGQSLHLQTEGTVTPELAYYTTLKAKAPAVTRLVGGHTAAIYDGAHLTLSSKNIKGAIVFNVGYGGRLSIGSEANQPKVEITGGFEFGAESGKSQVYLGPGSLLNGYISDQTQVSSGGFSPTFLMKNSTWEVNSQLFRAQNLSSRVSGLKLDHATVNLTSEQDTKGQRTYEDLTIGSLESNRGVFILDVDIENQKNDKVVITEGISAGNYVKEAEEGANFDSTENLLKNNSILRFVFSGSSTGGDSGVLVEAPIVVEGTRFQLEPKELDVNGKKAKYQVVDVGAYNYYLANKESSTDPNTRNWYLTLCKEGECLPLQSPPEPENPDIPNQPGNPELPDPGPAFPVYSPSAGAVFALSGMGSQIAFYQGQLTDLRKRLGEIRRDVRGEIRQGLWASVGAQKDRIAGFSSTSFKSTVYRFNFGYDTMADDWLIGANFKYASSNQKTKDAFFRAKGDAHSNGLNAYAVWHNEKGYYTDLILSMDRYHQKLNTSMLNGMKVHGTYHNWGIGVSAEVGKKSFINQQKTWFVEPQLQLAYYRIHGDSFTLSNGMKVKQGNFNSLTGRLGVAVGKDIKSSKGQDKGQVYLSAGVKNEFLGKQKITINGERFSDKLTGNRVYYGLATDWLLSKNFKVYGHIEREKGAHYTKEIEAQIGLKWQF